MEKLMAVMATETGCGGGGDSNGSIGNSNGGIASNGDSNGDTYGSSGGDGNSNGKGATTAALAVMMTIAATAMTGGTDNYFLKAAAKKTMAVVTAVAMVTETVLLTATIMTPMPTMVY